MQFVYLIKCDNPIMLIIGDFVILDILVTAKDFEFDLSGKLIFAFFSRPFGTK